MYLNLDLLYNINHFLFPLFYYNDGNTSEVYSAIYQRSVYKSNGIRYYHYYLDAINIINISKNKCAPFELSQKEIDFLENKNQ